MKPLHLLAFGLSAFMLTVSLDSGATVRREGTWPTSDKRVDLEFEGKPSEGIEKLAAEADWSIVVSKGVDLGVNDVKINVDDQRADAVLEALFADSDVVARRDGSLITITPAHGPAPASSTPPEAAPVPPVPPTPPAPPEAANAPPSPPPVPTVRGEDRDVFGSSLTVGKDEIVHTLTVTGGSAIVYGIVTGDLVVFGGSAVVEKGARVVGNATVFGGSLKVENGARVDGDVGIVGGSLKRESGSIIGGKVVDKDSGNAGAVKVSRKHDGGTETHVEEGSKRSSGRSRLADAAEDFGRQVTNMSLLFVLGCVLLALGTKKMDILRTEVAARPMKSFAMGIVGSLAALIGFIALCCTIVGIPFALLALLIGVFSVYGAICSVLVTFGAAVAGHKTKNPYVHLLVGVLVFLVLGAIPFVGGLVTLVVTMIAVGTLVSTRLAGVIVRRTPKSTMA